MTPAGLHLAASLLRLNRGIAVEMEKWIASQPPSPAMDELLEIVTTQRRVLTAYENQLRLVKVTT